MKLCCIADARLIWCVRGMGLACAHRLTGMVDTLLLVDRDEESAHTAAKELSAMASRRTGQLSTSAFSRMAVVRITPSIPGSPILAFR